MKNVATAAWHLSKALCEGVVARFALWSQTRRSVRTCTDFLGFMVKFLWWLGVLIFGCPTRIRCTPPVVCLFSTDLCPVIGDRSTVHANFGMYKLETSPINDQ